MKRTKVIALVLCAAVMLMGAGYAAWNETVTITNNVNTGNLSVELLAGTVAITPTIETLTHTGSGVTLTATATGEDKNTARVDLTNLFPGAQVVVTIPVRNDGTIPVKLDTAGITNTALPSWLTINGLTAPSTLGVGASGNITYTLAVPSTVGNAFETQNATFTVNANYIQFNQ